MIALVETSEKGDADTTTPLEGKRVLHAHYYEAALHRAITETGPVDGRKVLARAAASAAYRTLAGTTPGADAVSRLRTLVGSTGLGMLECEGNSAGGGTFTLVSSPFAATRPGAFGSASTPVCDIASGLMAGALGGIFGRVFSLSEVERFAAGEHAELVPKAIGDYPNVSSSRRKTGSAIRNHPLRNPRFRYAAPNSNRSVDIASANRRGSGMSRGGAW
jgi:predicted hydrocarbon binding protein